jgi:AGCS family alanine or glycine:cation symporter
MKKRQKWFGWLLGIICLILVLAVPAYSQDKKKEYSSSQGWVQGIEIPTPGYRTWVMGLEPPEAKPIEEKTGIDAIVEKFMTPINNVLYNGVFYSIPFFGAKLKIVIAWLIVGSLFCTFYFRFINLRGFTQAIRLVRGDYSNPNSDEAGEVSHFQALATALSGTVGVGNIGAIPILIMIGGPGALFWMMVAGFIGMSSKFVECTLGVMYRNNNPDGTVSGGPMYAMVKGFAELGRPKLGKFLSYFFAISLVIGCMGAGNMFQSNQAVMQFVNITGGANSYFASRGWIFGLVMAVIVGMVILGGIKGIAKVTEKLVPFMALFYLTGALVVLAAHANRIPEAVISIFANAFSPEGISGGFIGIMIIGFQRAVFSNEAGIGTAAIAHSAVKTDEPITEGLVSLLEPFIDTIVICTITGLVILTTVYGDPSIKGLTGVSLTSEAMSRTIPWVPIPLAVAVLLFAFSTIVSWSYYGLKGWTYLFGESNASSLTYKAVYCFFIIVGCSIPLTSVMDFSDAMVFLMTIPNILCIYFLAPVVKKELNSYWARIKSGEIKNYRQLRKRKRNTR